MQPTIVDALACPHDGGGLLLEGRVLGCAAGHRFDLAKQGYATLIRRPLAHPGDPAALLERRGRVHDAGLLDAVHDAVAAVARERAAGLAAGGGEPGGSGIVCDVGAGPGTYLATVLDTLPGHVGVAVDASRAAARRAARCHPRAAAVVADIWDVLPIRSGAVGLLLDIFAPRNPEEFARVVTPGGELVVATPATGHLAELRSAFDLLAIGEEKQERLRAGLQGRFEDAGSVRVEATITATAAQATDLAAMGASGHHLDDAVLQQGASTLPEQLPVTLAVTLSRFVRTGAPGAHDARR